MRHLLSRHPKSKKGVSTILGAIIFVGILVTSVFPLFLYVNEVNSYYNRVVAELSRFDQERGRECLEVYAYPVFIDSTVKLNIYVKNRCPLTINIVRIWVNNTNPGVGDLPLSISGASDLTIEGIPIPSTGDFNVWVTTERGNVFASGTNALHISEGGWTGGNPPYSINIIIQKKAGTATYKINVTTDPVYSTSVSSTGIYILSVVEIGYNPGTYNLMVTRTNPQQTLFDANITITPQNPSPWIYVEDDQ